LKQTVNQLSNQLEFVLSYLGLVNGGKADAGESGWVNLAEFPPLNGGESSTASVPVMPVVSTSTSAATVQHFPATSSNIHHGARSFREAAVAAVYADKAENDHRAASFIIRGMSTSTSSSDRDVVSRLCTGEFSQCPDIAFTKRLGRQLPGKVQPLLMYLKRTDQAKNILASARQLQQSADPVVRDNIFINENLTKAAARVAYEQRCRHRQIASQCCNS